MKPHLRTLTLAVTALLLIPLSSCGKDNKPTPTPPDPQPAKREDIIGKVHTMTISLFDKDGRTIERTKTTYNKSLLFTEAITEIEKNGKLTLNSQETFTYDASGRLILYKMHMPEEKYDKFDNYTYDQAGQLIQHNRHPGGTENWITHFTYSYENGKKKSGHSYEVDAAKGSNIKAESYYTYSYEGEVEIEKAYSDKELKLLVAQTKRVYDKLGRLTRLETITYDTPNRIDPFDTKIHETHYGILGEVIFQEITMYDAKKQISHHQRNTIRYTKYNTQGLPIAGVAIDERATDFTIEYTFY